MNKAIHNKMKTKKKTTTITQQKKKKTTTLSTNEIIIRQYHHKTHTTTTILKQRMPSPPPLPHKHGGIRQDQHTTQQYVNISTKKKNTTRAYQTRRIRK